MVTVVVGAGIIGTAIAHDLQKRGRQVVMVDRETPGMGASFGNMASIAVTEFMPAPPAGGKAKASSVAAPPDPVTGAERTALPR